MHFMWGGGRTCCGWKAFWGLNPDLRELAVPEGECGPCPRLCIVPWNLPYILTSCIRVFPQKPKRPKLLKKFPAFYGTRRFITAFRNVPYNWGKTTEKSQSRVHHLKHPPTLSLNVFVTRSHLNIRGAHKTWQHRTKALTRPDTNNVEQLQEYLRVDGRVCFAEN